MEQSETVRSAHRDVAGFADSHQLLLSSLAVVCLAKSARKNSQRAHALSRCLRCYIQNGIGLNRDENGIDGAGYLIDRRICFFAEQLGRPWIYEINFSLVANEFERLECIESGADLL